MPRDIKTLSEISHQPAVWRECLQSLAGGGVASLAEQHDPRQQPWIFVGCGTSYYLAQAAAASFTQLLQTPAFAVPASEILLQPSLVFPSGANACFPVLISRSGHTSEVLQAAEFLRGKGVEFLAVSCDGRELAEMTPHVLRLPVHEESTVMTSSFTSMLLALQHTAATIAGKQDFLDALHRLPEHTEELLNRFRGAVEEFASFGFRNIAALGQGVLYAIAAETALKVMESSSTYAQYFHTLEFRHGPKSVAGPETLIAGLVSESGYKEETAVLTEMKGLGSKVMAVCNTATEELRHTADLLIELNLPVPELARTVAYIVWGQLLGSYRGLAKGLDPDNPTNLSRVVTI